MSKIEWPSNKELLESIGYLASPGVVARIEAMVPVDKLDKFKNKYKGKYSSEFPYVMKAGSKYGEQLRLTLNDNDECPEFLRGKLDAKYGIRLNDTSFIQHLIQVFDFRITNSPQDSKRILENARFLDPSEYKVFLKGYNRNIDFIDKLKVKLDSQNLPEPTFIDVSANKTVNKNRVKATIETNNTSFTQKQLQNIGWIGEKYIYLLLLKRNRELIDNIGIDSKDYNICWFNNGFDTEDNWEDKSVGEGCDIIIETDNDRILIEIKTSNKDGNIFTMTQKEMVSMHEAQQRYFIFKINWIRNILQDRSPELIIYSNPYYNIFKPEQMKEATFYVRK